MILIIFHLLFCFVFIIPRLSYGTDTLRGDQFLSGNQTLVSKEGNFEMGFFKPGKSSHYYVGIWYSKINITHETIVWVGNREAPVSDIVFSKLKIKDSNLVLLNESNTQVWSTNTNSSASTAFVVLLDDGNLVLKNGSSSSAPIWQSFDHPTNTFLPGSKFGYEKSTYTSQLLTSWKNREDPSVGLFSLEFDQNLRQFVLKWNRSVQYWVSGPWNGHTCISMPEMRLNNIYNFSYVDNTNESYFTYSLYYPFTISRLILDFAGQIQLLSWLESSGQWNLFPARPREVCQVYAKCGPFGVCSQQSLPFCNCLPAFEPRSHSEWNLKSFSGGCVRKTKLNCRVNQETGFIVSYVPVNSISSFLGNETPSLNELACKRSCMDDCSCDAYSYILKICRLWNGENFNNISLVFVSENATEEKFEFNIKVASKDLPSHKRRSRVPVGTVAGSVVAVIFILSLIFLIICRKKRMYMKKMTTDGSLVAFDYKDLQKATKNFTEKLGGGGFGPVFKGILSDSLIVAVKKLESISQGEKEFRSEVSTIGIIQHVNLVPLRGFCAQGNNKLLVYDYMPNGSLNIHLFHEKQDNILTWKTRYEIALGIARGLVYLHEKCRDCIIHCDIKPENILLDAEFCPKIADFGMAKLVGRDFSRVLTTMRGTRGYLAPEWLSGEPVTAKADVFSYGMMLFELIHGTRNSQLSEDSDFTFFPSLAANIIMAGGDILSVVDIKLNREANVEQVMKIFKVAYWCIQDEEVNRPSMSQVEHILEGVLDVNMPPIPQLVQFYVDKTEHVLFFNASSSSQPQSNSRECYS